MSAAQERRAREREREIVDPVDAWPMRQKRLALSTSKIEMGNPTCRVRLASHTKQSEHASGTKTTAPVAEAVSDDGRRRCTSSGPNKKGSEEQPFCSPDANCDPDVADIKPTLPRGHTNGASSRANKKWEANQISSLTSFSARSRSRGWRLA